MSLLHHIADSIRQMVGHPAGVPFNAVAALERIAQRLLSLHASAKALEAERNLYRTLLCGIAWDFGQNLEQPLPQLVLLEWAPDVEPPKPEEKPRVEVVRPNLVSLH